MGQRPGVQKQESRIQEAEMRVLRLIVGRTRRERVRNERIKESIGVKSIINKMDAARLKMAGTYVKVAGGERGGSGRRGREDREEDPGKDEWSRLKAH